MLPQPVSHPAGFLYRVLPADFNNVVNFGGLSTLFDTRRVPSVANYFDTAILWLTCAGPVQVERHQEGPIARMDALMLPRLTPLRRAANQPQS
jgi:hypothetical protein